MGPEGWIHTVELGGCSPRARVGAQHGECTLWGLDSMVLGDCTPWTWGMHVVELWGLHTTGMNAAGLGAHTVWDEGLPRHGAAACPP